MGHFALGWKALFRVWNDNAFASQVGKWLGEHPAGMPADAAPTAPATARQPAEHVPLHPRPPRISTNRIPHAATDPLAPARSGEKGGGNHRHEALSLLATLQRDARLLDYLKAPLAQYSDAQVGAAARAVHKDAAAVIERFFGVEPLTAQAEGATVEVPPGYDPAKIRLVGNVPAAGNGSGGNGTLRGRLAHPGWKATRAEVPAWTGNTDSVTVLAPTEVEF